MPTLTVDLDQRRIVAGEQLILQEVRVLQIGAGGTGSEMFDVLIRADHTLRALGHPGLRITLQDGDEVSPFNIGRQRFAPADIGFNKAEVLARRYGLIYGRVIAAKPVPAIKRHFTQFDQFDLVITCVDRAAVRTAIADTWAKKPCNTIWLDTGNGASTGQVVLGSLSGAPSAHRLPNVLELFPSIRNAIDDDQPSCSMQQALRSQMMFVNRWMADIAGTMLHRLLTEGFIQQVGAIADLRAMRVTPIDVDPQMWHFLSGHTGEVRQGTRQAREPRNAKRGRGKSQPKRPAHNARPPRSSTIARGRRA